MTLVLAVIGAKALYLLLAWLACGIAASYLSGRKGFGERIGLASGLILAPIGVLIWLVWPPRASSDWKVKGPFGSGRKGPGETDPTAGRRSSGPTAGTGAKA